MAKSLKQKIKDGDIVKLSHQSRVSYDGTRDIPI